MKSIPKHIAVIMDGNGRWATKQGLNRTEGHRAGAKAIDSLLTSSLEFGLQNVSLYAFSTENWKRPILEVKSIFELLIEFITDRLDDIHSKGIRIKHSGSRNRIPKSALSSIDRAVERTSKNKTLTVNFCLNYGAKDEIIHAMNGLIQSRKSAKKDLLGKVTEKEFEKYLYTYPLPPVDLLIRTAGEQRISNFLLWQIAYAEVYFTKTLWPDFDRSALVDALQDYDKRIRKFGGL
ncbi:isoprenyl transferase [Leptospira sp. GIMC2001]|uniref:isoprenyl transferase n=1 Tax=Leptospira sp. GIMC2001 TaxID=1513297 RepID=UPI002348EF26|nr:isoprenyl transferase [Leptospira sp. GIMC2001]WCL51385.1 isoprenyl transferase [Leptospira sp. GIMC2001]